MAGENVLLTLSHLTRYDGKLKTWTEGVFKIVEQATAETGYLKTYVLQANGTNAADSVKINIPKDFLVKAAEVKTCTTADVPVAGYVVGDKYIDFTINTKDTAGGSETDTHIYIAVKDLVSTYTAGDGITLDPTTLSFSVDTGDGLAINGTSKKVEVSTGDGLGINSTSKAVEVKTGNGVEINSSTKVVDAKVSDNLQFTSGAIDIKTQNATSASDANAPAVGGITKADYVGFNGAFDTITPPTETAPTADSGKNETIVTKTHSFTTETVGGTSDTLTITEYYATYGEAVAADTTNNVAAKSGLMTGTEKANLAALIATLGADVSIATNADIDALFE